jgi:hypothetical protein
MTCARRQQVGDLAVGGDFSPISPRLSRLAAGCSVRWGCRRFVDKKKNEFFSCAGIINTLKQLPSTTTPKYETK